MNTTAICTAVVARLRADQGSGCLFASGGGSGLITGVYRNEAPGNATLPYVVLGVSVDSTDNTFTSRTLVTTVVVQIYTTIESAPSVVTAIELRIFGNAMSQTDRVPSFGLDNHNLSLTVGNFAGGTMEFISGADISDRDRNASELTFRVRQTWSAS